MAGISGDGSNNSPISDEVANEMKNIITKVFDDVGRGPAMRQILIGGISGWLTGYTLIKVGRATAAAIGSGIILLQIANHNGYININWDKVTKRAEQISNQLDESSSSSSKTRGIFKKVEKFVDKKLDKAENALKKKERKVKKWYARKFDDEYFVFEEIHVFFVTFLTGIAIGLSFAIILR